jgi:hypothetical protein
MHIPDHNDLSCNLEIQLLRQSDSVNTDAIANLSDQVMKLMEEVQELKKQQS